MRSCFAVLAITFFALSTPAMSRADGGPKPLSMLEVTFPTPQLANFDDAFKARIQATPKFKLRLYYFNSWPNQFQSDPALKEKVKQIRAFMKSVIRGHAGAMAVETIDPEEAAVDPGS